MFFLNSAYSSTGSGPLFSPHFEEMTQPPYRILSKNPKRRSYESKTNCASFGISAGASLLSKTNHQNNYDQSICLSPHIFVPLPLNKSEIL
eukprot:TRINITY_DN4289_c0_g1_i1.p1 TRINITY_DN4289_c0_g1~~TRINITY_DN4289_c0_g1_i1.p1  ORF type:complete len:103 (+),score=10.33 TRINITY_DN4289_c0_g1_i1:37-309(+)